MALDRATVTTPTASTKIVARSWHLRHAIAMQARWIALMSFDFGATADRAGSAGSLVIVANRLPIECGADGRVQPSPGGLASALGALNANATWIGWTGSTSPSLPTAGQRRLTPIRLTDDDIDGYYLGFANSTLWPLLHGCLRSPTFSRAWYRVYRRVNERYAVAASQAAPLGALVWVHDYHLLLVPQLLRSVRPDVRIGMFLHTPVPSPDLLATLPWRRQLMYGIAGADLLGLQTERDSANITAAFDRFLDGGRDTAPPELRRGPGTGTFPISIDFDRWNTLGEASACRPTRDTGPRADRFVFLGVDRLDYTKGIDQRLRAFCELLDDGRLDPATCRFVQVSVPSRTQLPDYRAESDRVGRIVQLINSRHRRRDGRPPVEHIRAQLGSTDLAALYRAADCMVVTPYADGMNLVAKEFVACRGDLDGTLLLSEYAGAARHLSGALIVNPYDLDAVKRAMLTARTMSEGERRSRMVTMRAEVRAHDVHAWARSFLERLARIDQWPAARGTARASAISRSAAAVGT
jgi:trehalose 6-phosphate synthase